MILLLLSLLLLFLGLSPLLSRGQALSPDHISAFATVFDLLFAYFIHLLLGDHPLMPEVKSELSLLLVHTLLDCFLGLTSLELQLRYMSSIGLRDVISHGMLGVEVVMPL